MLRRLIIDVLAFEKGKAYGYQEYIFNLLDYLYAHRANILYEEIILVCIKNQQTYFEKYLDKFQIKSYNCSSVYKRLIIQSYMPFDLSLNKYDLVLYTSNYSSLFSKATQILVIHDLLFRRKKLFPYRLMRWQRLLYLPISIRNANKIIAISKFTANDIKSYYKNSANKIVVIYNYFNFRKYPSVSSLAKKNCFISVCSSAFHKNTITVLKAFYEYCINGGTFNLILVGALQTQTPSYKFFNRLSNLVKNRIKIYSNISNDLLAELYSKSNAYISASLFEGLGMPIVEAMFFNLPVILSDYPVFHEVSLNLGHYFNPLNKEELVKKMFEIESGLVCTCNLKENVMEKYSEENTSQKYLDLFNELYNNIK